MRTIYTIVCLLGMGGSLSFAQGIHFPDENLEHQLLHEYIADLDGDGASDSRADINQDGMVTTEEAEQVLGLLLFDADIESLTGLEYFVNLQNLNCSSNQIAAVPTPYYPQLRSLSVVNNPLIALNLQQNSMLEKLYVGGSPDLESLDLSQNQNLTLLRMGSCDITSLDLSQNVLLESMTIKNTPLVGLDLTYNTALEYLTFYSTTLQSLDISSLEALDYLDIELPLVNTLDFSNNPELHTVFLTNMALPIIDMRQTSNLLFLMLENVSTPELRLDNLELFDGLRINFSDVPSLDLSSVPNFKTVMLREAGISYLNLQNGNNEAIEFLSSRDNPDLRCILVDDPDYAAQVPCIDGVVPKFCIEENTSYSLDCILAGSDFSRADLRLYPNPASNFIHLQTEMSLDIVSIFDLSGKLVLEAYTERIDVSQLSNGLYFLKASAGSMEQTLKFVKR